MACSSYIPFQLLYLCHSRHNNTWNITYQFPIKGSDCPYPDMDDWQILLKLMLFSRFFGGFIQIHMLLLIFYHISCEQATIFFSFQYRKTLLQNQWHRPFPRTRNSNTSCLSSCLGFCPYGTDRLPYLRFIFIP